jgi:hypothetical protein
VSAATIGGIEIDAVRPDGEGGDRLDQQYRRVPRIDV